MIKVKEDSIGEQNRVKILASAEKEFALHGFKGARVQKIADRAGLPKTNVLYYFKTKEGLYLALLDNILNLWNGHFDDVTSEDDPAEVLARYIVDKMEISRTRPNASKIFALEIINNAPNLNEFFKDQHMDWMNGRVAVIQGWIDAGKLKPLDPFCLLLHIWATTQHYADFSAQIVELKGKKMDKKAFDNASCELVSLILLGCGLTIPDAYRKGAN
jgi:TetR/AcrR family transcriptional regulator